LPWHVACDTERIELFREGGSMSKRLVAIAGLALLLMMFGVPRAHAQEPFVFLTSWYAQAEHGGFYQALATGLYKKAGLDVSIKMGGPQVNGMQILAAGQADAIMGYDIAVLKGREQGVDAVTVAASFQKDLQGLMTREDVKSLGELKGKTILVATSGRSTWWPWLKTRYGLAEEQTRPYTFNIQPFLADANIVQQGYPSSEPFAAAKAGTKVNFFLFADAGYPPYGTTIVTMDKTVATRAEVLKKFVAASMEGWKSFMADPSPAIALIKKDNPNMTDETILFAIRRMKELEVLGSGDAKSQGIGTIREERFKATYDMLVQNKLLDPKVDWRKSFTTQFVKDLRVLP
jgi:NitT/TauT family transport system substrate-binding protein